MKVQSIRRLTRDSNHNAFTGAQWFQGALYVAFRQGTSHVDPSGRLVVMRSRDEGVNFETVAVIRGEFDTRDAHLYADGDHRLYVTGFERGESVQGSTVHAGRASTENGLHWSSWERYEGTGQFILWRPQFLQGTHYSAGYRVQLTKGQIGRTTLAWFESPDGLVWEQKQVLIEGPENANEASLVFDRDGNAVMLVRREHEGRRPFLMRSAPPYREWTSQELDVPLAGLALWLCHDQIWFSGRWFVNPETAHVAMFRLEADQPKLQLVLPSGPGFDCSYMGVARHPHESSRFHLSYYSNHAALDDPAECQWEKPDIYLADVTFTMPFIRRWRVSDLENKSLAEAAFPSVDQVKTWKPVNLTRSEIGFSDVSEFIDERPGVIALHTELEVGPIDAGIIHLGWDGPVKAWLNGELILDADGTNPALPDQRSIPVHFQHGTNRLAVALDTNGGRACGVFARYETR